MEIQVQKLRDTLALIEPAVPRKPTMPVLRGVRLGDGQVVATDLEVGVAVELPEATELKAPLRIVYCRSSTVPLLGQIRFSAAANLEKLGVWCQGI